MPRKLTYKLILVIGFFTTGINSQIKVPPINNFTTDDYHGGNQNWDIASSEDYIYVGNNEGLMEFDGNHWFLNTLPNKTIIRSLLVINDKIYTGSYEEFGFWERKNNGKLAYKSLSDAIELDQIASQSIWDIYKYQNSIIFKSFSSLFIYENDSIRIVDPDFILMGANVINDRFFVQGIGKGLLELKNDELVIIDDSDEIANTRVQSLIPFNDDSILIGTSLDGLYNYHPQRGIEKWNNQFNELVKEHQLNTLTIYKNNLYVGTIKNGIYQYNINDESYLSLNVKNGLQNNTVLASILDKDNNLWVALDNGIAAIPTQYYIYFLNPYKEDIGAVYDIVQLDSRVYIATNVGIYSSDDNGTEFIEGSQGHTWSLTELKEGIICGHNSGTFLIKNNKFSNISPKNGGYVFKSIPQQNNKYIQANYSGLTVYEKTELNWLYSDVENLNMPIKNIVFEKPKVAWILHAYKGIFKVRFSDNYDRVISIDDSYNGAFENVYDIKLFNVEGDIAFFSNDQWYVYNKLEDRIEHFDSLDKVLGKDKNSIVLNKFEDTPVLFKKSDNTIFIRDHLRDSLSQKYLPKKYYKNRLVRSEGEQRAVVINDSLVYIALYNDILALNPKELVSNSSTKKPGISRIYKNNKLEGINSKLTVKRNDTIRIMLSSHYLSNYSVEYSLDNKSWNKTDGTVVLTGFSRGTTKLKIRSYLNSKEYSEALEIELFVKSPWYLGIWGLIVLVSAILLTIYLISIINKYVLIKHKKYLDEQYQHEQEIHRREEALKNEKKVNELLTRQHEIELHAKTKELANTAMEMTKKDELLDTIKKELELFKTEIISKNEFEKLIRTINRNINTSKDWEVFESNFNEIHDSFFKSLVKKHSNLTPKDLKLCAYLKMNLSTKEIAPLMGISNRGVEIHRYRLRKKLNLDTDQNLNEYLMNLT